AARGDEGAQAHRRLAVVREVEAPELAGDAVHRLRRDDEARAPARRVVDERRPRIPGLRVGLRGDALGEGPGELPAVDAPHVEVEEPRRDRRGLELLELLGGGGLAAVLDRTAGRR